jgi:hypothetical protein
MGFSVGSAVSSAVEKQLSAYLPAGKEDTANFESSTSVSDENLTAKSVPAKLLNKARLYFPDD